MSTRCRLSVNVKGIVVAIIWALAENAAHSQTFTIRNDTGSLMEIWLFRQASSNWVRYTVPRNEELHLKVVTKGPCRLVAREPSDGPKYRDHEIGWFDLARITEKNTSPFLRLSKVAEMLTIIENGKPKTVSRGRIIGEWKGVSKADMEQYLDSPPK